ncbi:hypothetical protein [Thermostaphylospora chromogena]|uniref:hypothetical protein n=1 Tax=Thermostaphylospora chromogena TaxID=35622 RepID=UPI000B898D88|nr:hypothetical protein [Thermostaphylospora chromogena]
MTTDDPIVAVMADVARLSQRLDQYGAQLDTTNHGTAELASRLDAIDAALTDLARTVTDLAEAVAAATKRDAAAVRLSVPTGGPIVGLGFCSRAKAPGLVRRSPSCAHGSRGSSSRSTANT